MLGVSERDGDRSGSGSARKRWRRRKRPGVLGGTDGCASGWAYAEALGIRRKGAGAVVAVGEKVRVQYRGLLDDGTQFDSSYDRGQPVEFTVGSGQMIPGFDFAVSNMEVGEKRTVRIAPADAYGEYDDAGLLRVPCDSLPRWEELPLGRPIMLTTPQGPVRVICRNVEDGMLLIDTNHELAGKHLTFEIELVAIMRESAIEREKHGDGCACGCHTFKEAITRQNAERENASAGEVRIWSIDAQNNQLVGEDGQRFREVETNLWTPVADGAARCGVVYLGTGKHGDRITLRPLYEKMDDGRWVNVHTGADAPFDDERKACW